MAKHQFVAGADKQKPKGEKPMTTDDIYKGLLALSDKMTMGTKPTILDQATVLEAAAFMLEQMARSQERHPATQTSNGDPVATYFNNVYTLKKAGL